MTESAILLAFGIGLAALGGDHFVRGLIGLASMWRVPPGIIAATVAAFATSAPELSVAVNSAAAGRPEIALGDVLGSNVVNIGLILGIALLFAPVPVNTATVVRDFPAAVAAPLLVGLMALDGTLGAVDGLMLIVVFGAWMARTVLAARRSHMNGVPGPAERSRAAVWGSLTLGLLLLIAAGRAIVPGAVGMSTALGWDGFVVGAVLVALGTSAPELTTVIVARLRGHDDVAVGTILGSNIFNTLLILGTAAVIHPITVNSVETDIGLWASVSLVLLIIPFGGRLARWRAVPLLCTYFAMLGVLAL